MAADSVDYSLYLVTDSTPAILGSRDLVSIVDSACANGVTIVQYRDKTSDTGELVKIAKALHAVTRKYNVPLLINDRIDVALAVGCEGVHIGQDDIDLETARNLLGKEAIIGVTVSSTEEAEKACSGGADYLGIGTVYSTQTKKNTKSIIGTAGVKAVLGSIAEQHSGVRTVCIGGINASNVQRIIYQSSDAKKALDGVAVVSAIIAAPDVKKAAQELKTLITSLPPFAASAATSKSRTVGDLLKAVPEVVKSVGEKTPLSHNMTNLVVQNFAANVAICCGMSPIMSNNGEEASDLSKLGGALVINMGTTTPDGLAQYIKAIQAYNLQGGPVIYDPVGAGATSVRKAAVKTLMANGYFSVIKGNENEIRTVYGEIGVVQRGVDSGASTMDHAAKITLVKNLAARERCVVLMTGKTDFVSDGQRVYTVENGHELLGEITGSGCVLGTIVSGMLAVEGEDHLVAAVAGLLHYELAAESAARLDSVRGPGTFIPSLLDELYRIRQRTLAGDYSWLNDAKVKLVEG